METMTHDTRPNALYPGRVLGALLAICSLTPAPALFAHDDQPPVVLFEDADFRGQGVAFYRNTPDLSDSRLGNDVASSVTVARGCRVTLYSDHDFRGEAVTLADDESHLGRTPVGNDQVSSLRIDCRFDHDPDWREGKGVVLYQDSDFRGRSEMLTRDDRDLRDNPIDNDTVSSVRIAPGCQVTLFSDSEFRGRTEVLNRDTPSLAVTRLGDDALSSLKINCGDDPRWDGRTGAVLYADEDFRGRSEVVSGRDPDLRNNRVGNDGVSSVRIAPGCQITLYSDTDFRGQAAVLTFDTPSLAGTRLGNDYASSFEVSCGDDPRWDGRRGAVVYRDADFRGQSEIFQKDDPELDGNRIGNDQISSLRVAPGCRVTLFADAGYRGASTIITADAPSLTSSRVGNDGASSLRVECGHGSDPGDPGPPFHRGVMLFSDEDFRGRSEVFAASDRDLRDNPIGANRASSIRVAPGCRAILYEGSGYRGGSAVITEDTPSLGATRIGNDGVSSLEVACGGDGQPLPPPRPLPDPAPGPHPGPRLEHGVELFTEENFRGTREVLTADDRNLSNNRVRNDAVRSLRLAPGCRAILYADTNFEGRSLLVSEDVVSLGQTRIGNDELSSLEVECRH